MSVAVSNRYAFLLDDDAEEAPAPVPAKKVAPAPAAASNNAAPKQSRGDYPSRGQGRKVFQEPREVNADAVVSDVKDDRAPRGGREGRGGGRGGRGRGNPRSGAGTYLGGDRPRRENGGGRPFDRQSQTGHQDSAKQEAQGWGADEGQAELQSEQQGEADAQAEEAAAAAPEKPVVSAPIPEEEEDNTQTFEEYLAAQAAKKLTIGGKLPEARAANEGADDSAWKDAVAIARKGEAEEEWFTGAKPSAPKARKQKESKTFIEIEPTGYRPPRREGPPREGGRGRGRGGRGRGEGRGGFGGRGGPRRDQNSNAVNVEDQSAFPALA